MSIKKQPERRQFGRRAVFKAAVIALDDGQRLAGTIVDMSSSGARIKTPDVPRITPEFDLEIPEDDVVIRCRIANADEASIGAEYVKPPRRISWTKRRG